jgi:methylase of polypeptide subunit release factors
MSSKKNLPNNNEVLNTYECSLKPSQYTCMLLEQASIYFSSPSCKSVLDIGVGSGVILAEAAQKGVKELWGVDINAFAINAAGELLKAVSPDLTPHLMIGDMWAPLPLGIRYSLIVANLPHFPGKHHDKNRPAGWGGGEGRETMNRFIVGLPERLAGDGFALITHHDLIEFEVTRALITDCGLRFETITEWLVFEPPERMQSVDKKTLESLNKIINYHGGYAFMNSRILKIFH